MPTGTMERYTRVSRGTQVGRPRPNPKNLKKTTRKGAYNKRAKKNFSIRRAPMVEMKKRTQELIATGTASPNNIPDGIAVTHAINFDNAFEFVPVWSFLSMTRGIGSDQMIGHSVYAKYLKSRITVTLGKGLVTPGYAGIAESLRCIWGWVTAPMNLSAYTDPVLNAVDRSDLQNHIIAQVKEFYDDRGDPLRFNTKRTANIKILGNKKVVRKASQYNMQPAPYYDNDQGELLIAGTADEVTITSTWPMERKIQYQESHQQSGEADTWYYPATSWLPFIVFYSPRFEATTSGPTFHYNNVFYFTDS